MKKTSKVWQRVLNSRKTTRPQSKDFIKNLFNNFIELSGDRAFSDDKALLCGIATFDNIPITIIAQNRGRDLKQIKETRNGMALPEGYRKALRLMKQAEKFNRPIICFVDTPAAAANLEAEERGISEAIAKNLMEMSRIKVPILTIVISLGGSGGALGLSVANEIWSLENSYYSILSPEGFATILWKDIKKASEASEVMKSTAQELFYAKIIDKVILEPKVGIDKNAEPVYKKIRQNLKVFLKKYKPGSRVAKKRINKFKNFYPL